MKKLLCGFLLLVSAWANSTPAGAASVVLGQAGPSGVSAIISPDPGEIGLPANIWMGGVLNGTLYLRDGPSPTNWAVYRGGPFPIALTSAALPSSLQVSIVNIDISSLSGLDVYVGYGSTEADLSRSGHLAKVYTTIPTPVATPVGVATGSATSATIGAAGGTVSAPDGKIALTIPAGALASNTVISIQPLTNMAHGKIGAAYRLTPDGQTFLTPVTLTFPYTDQDLLGTAVEVLGAAYQTADGYWHWAGDATVDTAAKTVSIASSHFTDMSLVRGLQIRPPSKTVKVNGSVGLRVVGCYAPADTIPGTELVPLGYDCDIGAGRPIVNPVSEWSVNGGRAGYGTVSGSGSTATYTAPAFEPIPNPVTVSARVDWGARGTALLVSIITIAEDSWTGTASGVDPPTNETGTADVTWTLDRIVDNIAVFLPTGTVRISRLQEPCTYTFNPSSHALDPSTDGRLVIDYNTNPPTYHGYGSSSWPATETDGGDPGRCGQEETYPILAIAQFLFGSGGPGGIYAAGVVSADGTTIEGRDITGDGLIYNWRFTRD